jgi:hypothetical protein
MSGPQLGAGLLQVFYVLIFALLAILLVIAGVTARRRR